MCVVSNALRLNLFKVNSTKHDKPIRHKARKADGAERAETPAAPAPAQAACPASCGETRTVYIEGMMCGHCERTVKGLLEALDGVSEAQVSHEKGIAVVTLTSAVSDEALKQAVESDEEYKVTKIA